MAFTFSTNPSIVIAVSVYLFLIECTQSSEIYSSESQIVLPFRNPGIGAGEGEIAVFGAKRWDRRSRADLIESVTPCHDAQVVEPYRVRS